MSSNGKARGAGSRGKSVGGRRKREDIGKMGDLLRKAREGSSSLFTQSMSKRIEFSTLSLCVYDRHRILINDIFLNPNINTFVSYNDKNLHSWDPETKELISQINFNDAESSSIQSISCLCYSPRYHLYFACSRDFKLIVFNEHLNTVYQQRMPVGLVSVIVFYEAGGQLLVGGKEGCFIIDLQIKPHYDPRTATLLDPKGRHVPLSIKTLASGSEAAGADGERGTGQADGKLQIQREDNHADGVNPNASKPKLDGASQNDNMPVHYDYDNKQGYDVKQLQGVGEWVKGLKVFESQNLIVVWKKEILSGNGTSAAQSEEASKSCKIKPTRDQIMFYALESSGQYQQGEVWSRYYDSSIKEDFITDILVFKEQKRFVTAHHFGDIHLRKLDELKNMDMEAVETSGNKEGGGFGDQAKENAPSQALSTGSKSVHVFKGHSRTVTSLAPVESKAQSNSADATAPNCYNFVSAGLDGKVRIWDYEKMIELYCFDIQLDSPVQNSAMADSIMHVKLINDKIYAMIFKSGIEIGLISHLASSYHISKQNIGSIGKCYSSSHDRHVNSPQSLFISFNDNSIVLLDPKEYAEKDKHMKKPNITIYPPPTPAEVIKVFYCTSIHRMFLLLKTGSICVYEIGKETGTLEKLQESKSLKDYEGKSTNQGITCITTAYTQPPNFDCEIAISDLHGYKEPIEPDYEFVNDGDDLDQFLVIGLSKGTILFVKVNNMDHIFARFSIHRQAVKHIHEVRVDKVFLSICEEHLLHIWGFEEGCDKAQVYKEINLHREVLTIVNGRLLNKKTLFKVEDAEKEEVEQQEEKEEQPEQECLYHNIKKDSNQNPVPEKDSKKTASTAAKKKMPENKVESSKADPKAKKANATEQEGAKTQQIPPEEQIVAINEVLESVGKSQQLLMCFKGGGSEVLVWDHDLKQLNRSTKGDKSDEHEDAITCCDALPSLGRFVSGDKDGLVKIWNAKKQLIREIKFVEAVNSAAFLNEQGDIIVGHSGNLSRLNSANYMDRKMLVNDQDLEEFMAAREEVDEAWFEGMSQKGGKATETHQVVRKPLEQKAIAQAKAPGKSSEPVEKVEASGRKAVEAEREAQPITRTQEVAVKAHAKPIPTQPHQAASAGQQLSTMLNPQAPGAPGGGTQAGGPHINIQTYDPNTSQSNTGSQMNSTMKARDMRNQLAEMKRECVSIPSVPVAFMKNRKKIQAKEKQNFIMKNSTRRMMTEQRIQRNIQKNNIPAAPTRFHDVFVSQAASQGNILYAYGQPLRTGGQSEHGVQTSKHSRGNPLSRSAFFNNSKGFKKDAAMERSYFSQYDSQIQRKEENKVDKISQMQAALQVMAQSANTFSIFDNNSFHGYRVPNHRLNAIVKNQKLEQNFMSQLSQNQMARIDNVFQSSQKEDRPEQADETVVVADTTLKEKDISQSHPQAHHYVATVKMHQNSPGLQISKELRKSEEFSLKEENLKENPLGPAGSPFLRSTNRVQLLNSTLQKSHLSTVGGHAEGTGAKRLSPLQGQEHLQNATLVKGDIKIGTFTAQQRDDKADSSRDGSPLMSMQNKKAKLHADNNQAKTDPGLNKGSTETSLDQYNGGLTQNQLPAFGDDGGREGQGNDGKDAAQTVSSLNGQQQETKEGAEAAPKGEDQGKAEPGASEQTGEVVPSGPPKAGADEDGQAAHGDQDEFRIQNDEDPTREDLDDDDDGVLVKTTQQNAASDQQDDKDAGRGSAGPDANRGRFFVVKKVAQQQAEESQGLSAGTITGGLADGANNKYSAAVVQLDATASQMSQQQFDMSDAQFEPAQQVAEQRQYSQKIRGSARTHANHFVSTRLQQRAAQLQQIQPHLISNAKVKADFSKVGATARNAMVLQTKGDLPPDATGSPGMDQWSQGNVPLPNAMKNQFRDQSPNVAHSFPKKRALKSMGAGEGSQGHAPDLYVARDPGEMMGSSHANQFPRGPAEGLAPSGKPYGATSNLASQKTGLQSVGNQKHETSGSPQSRQNNHQRLADELMLGNEQVRYGLSSNQTTHRQGGVITSSQPAAGNPVYLRNAMTQGAHMPSKGAFNHPKIAQGLHQAQPKPRTAAAGTKRTKKFQSLVNVDETQHGSVGVMGPASGPGNVQVSGYRKNMNNIQMLSNQAKLTKKHQNYPTGPLAATQGPRNITSAGVVMHPTQQAYMD